MNPFYLIPHTPEPYFCDRKKETEDLVHFLENGQNVTLIAPRRYGKTGLIYHVFDKLAKKKGRMELFYVDVATGITTVNIDRVPTKSLLVRGHRKSNSS